MYLVATDGSDTRRLTTGTSEIGDGGQGGATAWSPDGREIVFERAADLWIVEVATGAERRLVAGTNPSWSPDGSWIADRYNGQLAIVAPDGSNYRNFPVGMDIQPPSWTPDGQMLVGTSAGIQRVDPSTGIVQSVTSGDDHDVTVSPDGSRLAFWRFYPDGGWYLLVTAADGAGGTTLANDPGINFDAPSWSADGAELAWFQAGLLWLDRIDERSLQSFSGIASAGDTRWSPDGTSLVVVGYSPAEAGAGLSPFQPLALWLVQPGSTPVSLAATPYFDPTTGGQAGATEEITLPKGLVPVGMSPELVIVQATLPVAIPLAPVDPAPTADGKAAFTVPALPPGSYDVFGANGTIRGAWVAKLSVSGSSPSLLTILAVAMWFVALVIVVRPPSARAEHRVLGLGAVLVVPLATGWSSSLPAAFVGLLLIAIGQALLRRRFFGVAKGRLARLGLRLGGAGALLTAGAVPLATLISASSTIASVLEGLGLVFLTGSTLWVFAVRSRDRRAMFEPAWWLIASVVTGVATIAVKSPDLIAQQLAIGAFAVAWLIRAVRPISVPPQLAPASTAAVA